MRTSIEAVYPRLVTGGICVIDDYENVAFPGAKHAIDSFMQDKPEALIVTVGKIQAYFVNDSHKLAAHSMSEKQKAKDSGLSDDLTQLCKNLLNDVADTHKIFRVEQLRCPHLRAVGKIVFPDGDIAR